MRCQELELSFDRMTNSSSARTPAYFTATHHHFFMAPTQSAKRQTTDAEILDRRAQAAWEYRQRWVLCARLSTYLTAEVAIVLL